MAESSHLLRGTLDLLILKSLSWGPRHGYGIAEWIEATTDDELEIMEGTIYPALHRMAKRGWIQAEWGPSDNNRRAKFYELTPKGRGELEQETARWRWVSEGVGLVLEAESA